MFQGWLGIINASTQKGKDNGLIANNSRVFEKGMFFVGCYPHVLNIMLRRMYQAGFGAKGDMNNNHVLQLLYKGWLAWLHHQRPSQYKSMYESYVESHPFPSPLLTRGGHTTTRHFNGA